MVSVSRVQDPKNSLQSFSSPGSSVISKSLTNIERNMPDYSSLVKEPSSSILVSESNDSTFITSVSTTISTSIVLSSKNTLTTVTSKAKTVLTSSKPPSMVIVATQEIQTKKMSAFDQRFNSTPSNRNIANTQGSGAELSTTNIPSKKTFNFTSVTNSLMGKSPPI